MPSTNEFLAEMTAAAAQVGKLLIVVRSDDDYRARRGEAFAAFAERRPVALVVVGRVPATKLCPVAAVEFLAGEDPMLPSDAAAAERLAEWVGR